MISSGVHGCVLHSERPMSATARAREYSATVRRPNMSRSRASSTSSSASSSAPYEKDFLDLGFGERPNSASSDDLGCSYRLPADCSFGDGMRSFSSASIREPAYLE